jgi:hypothetical protein
LRGSPEARWKLTGAALLCRRTHGQLEGRRGRPSAGKDGPTRHEIGLRAAVAVVDAAIKHPCT